MGCNQKAVQGHLLENEALLLYEQMVLARSALQIRRRCRSVLVLVAVVVEAAGAGGVLVS